MGLRKREEKKSEVMDEKIEMKEIDGEKES